MKDIEKAIVMAETGQNLVNMIQKRMTNRLNALNALESFGIPELPDEVKKMREVEASRIRAVMQEQADLMDIILMLYPNVKAQNIKPDAKTK